MKKCLDHDLANVQCNVKAGERGDICYFQPVGFFFKSIRIKEAGCFCRIFGFYWPGWIDLGVCLGWVEICWGCGLE